jgi:hypothetical protein
MSEWMMDARVDGRMLNGGVWARSGKPCVYSTMLTPEPGRPTMAKVGCLTFAAAVRKIVSTEITC